MTLISIIQQNMTEQDVRDGHLILLAESHDETIAVRV